MIAYQSARSMCSAGRKHRFGAAGIANLAVSNGFLQALLAANVPIAISTLATQLLNALIGYLTYGKYVFRARIRDFNSATRYTALASLLWVFNWVGIVAMQSSGVSKSLAAIAMVPPLAVTSYIIQRKWVFRKP